MSRARLSAYVPRAVAASAVAAMLAAPGAARAEAPGMPDTLEGYRFVNAFVVSEPDNPLHGFHHFYVNDRGVEAFRKGGPYPEGSEFLGLVYALEQGEGTLNEGEPAAVAVMRKVAAAEDTGGWRFALFGNDGTAKDIDEAKDCFECHTQVADRDYVFSKPRSVGGIAVAGKSTMDDEQAAPGPAQGAPGQASDEDAILEQRINERLAWDKELAPFDLEAEVDNAIVTLSGSVATIPQSHRARRIADEARGSGGVVNATYVDPALAVTADTPRPEDATLKQRIGEILAGDADVDAGQVEIRVEGGRVTLAGQVGDAEQKARAARIVRSLYGVGLVDNELAIARQ
ncbi:MAG: BON domain-containing protein [Thiohalocapsa sp.]|nr:BON domain-containing protein [Thiohalocapsa sp.]